MSARPHLNKNLKLSNRDERVQTPNIIYAWNYVEWGGAQIYTLGLIKFLRPEFNVLVVLPEGSSEELLGFLRERGIDFEFFSPAADMKPAHGLQRRIERRRRKKRSENALVAHLLEKDLSYTIIHIDLSPQQSLRSLIRLCRIAPVFFTAHNSLPNFSAWREALWRAKFAIISRYKNFNVFCANEDTKRYLSRFVGHAFAERITVTPAAIDAEEMSSIFEEAVNIHDLRARFAVPPEKFVVLTVGQFIDRKGRWDLLKAAAKVVKEQDDIVFVWLMPRLPGANDNARIRKYGLGDAFHPVLSGSVGKTRIEILRFFRIADIFVLPSLLEGLPISLLEAMSLGLPSIATSINAIPEAIQQSETGILVPPGEPDRLAEEIIRLRVDEVLRNKLSDAGRRFAIGNFSDRQTADKALAKYRESLEN